MKTQRGYYLLPNKNYKAGAGFEARFIAKLLKQGIAVKAGRFYASKGVTDVWWVDKKGVHNEAQLKYSAIKKPYITPHEKQELIRFSIKMKGCMDVWLVKKQSRKTLDMELII